MRILNSQSGFTIAETMVALCISTIAVFAISNIIISTADTKKNLNSLNSTDEFKGSIKSHLQSTCALENTINDRANSSMKCLRDGSNCSSQSGLINFKDNNDLLIIESLKASSGFDKSGQSCNSFNESQGNSACPFRWEISWKPLCTGSCTSPQIELSAFLKYAPEAAKAGNTLLYNESRFKFKVIKNYKKSYTSCKAAFDQGQTTSDIYRIDPDGSGGICPFDVYCDMANDGGGWTLIINSNISNYTSTPTLNIPTPVNLGILSDEKIEKILLAADNAFNNVKVKVTDGSVIDNVISFKVKDYKKGHYTANDNSCDNYDKNTLIAQFSSSSTWGFFATNANGKIGFADITSASPNQVDGYNGFTCDACSNNTSCGYSSGDCCQGKLRGQVWVR